MVVKVKIFVVILVLFQLNCSTATKKTASPEEAREEAIEKVEKKLQEASQGEEPVNLPKEAESESEKPKKHEPPQLKTNQVDTMAQLQPTVGAARFSEYLPLLKDKNVALVVNHTSMVGNTHLADTLMSQGVMIKKIFAPEHGFRGEEADGATIADGRDEKTGILITSLYGDKKKPSKADLAGLDVVIFDIQDVGTRFYTYISTMTYVMEACAENNLEVLILDRPNPNGHYVDGPVREPGYESFVGMHQIPVVHGMTIAEYAQMVNGEGWLKNGVKAKLKWVLCENYDHQTFYQLPIKPSPNLPNMRSVYLYPSLCFFEGTEANLGRGTTMQFQVIGHPNYPKKDFSYVPVSRPGATHPKHEGVVCYGYDLRNIPIEDLQKKRQLDLSYLLSFYLDLPTKERFFLKSLYFDTLAGTSELRKQVIAGKTESEIRASWEPKLSQYKTLRKKYLLYADFAENQ